MHRYFSKTLYPNILDPLTKPQKTKVMTMNPYTCIKYHNSFFFLIPCYPMLLLMIISYFMLSRMHDYNIIQMIITI